MPIIMSSMSSLHKIVVKLDPNAWHGHATETLWAEKVGQGRYRLRSVPYFARGLSVEDIVNTEKEEDRDVITNVSIHGGHSTYRMFLATDISPESSAFIDHWRALSALGCTFERASQHLFAVDVPSAADIRRVYELLSRGEGDGVWEFEEGKAPPLS
jgi:hypothetical protein